MRKAMAKALVGDERNGTDPTVNMLNQTVAELLGKEACIFVPSGTMCNLLSVLVHCNRGDEIICDKSAHIYNYEGGAYAGIAQVGVATIESQRGIFTSEQVAKIVRKGVSTPQSKMVVIEQTVMEHGGVPWSLNEVQSVFAVAKYYGLKVHIDGARLFNAVAATGVSAKDYASGCDSVWIDFTKGLGAPFGACLAGSKDFIQKAWRAKLQLGGGMRQVGIVAAAALYSLHNNVEKLHHDHRRAKILACDIADIKGIEVSVPETNIIFAKPSPSVSLKSFVQMLLAEGVIVRIHNTSCIRLVLHLGISDQDVKKTIEAFQHVAKQYRNLAV
jgi:threonine aldolase